MRTRRLLRTALLAICLSTGLTACRHVKVVVIDQNTTVVRITNGVPGYFVPDATMKRILDRLSEEEVFGK